MGRLVAITDLLVNRRGRKLNGMINKLVYVHEGIEKDVPKSKHHHLVNVHYFCGTNILSETIKDGNKEELLPVVDMPEYHVESANEKKCIQEGVSYIIEDWSAARTRLRYRRIPGCSTEGHVSHILSKRMSMTPMGWSRRGADKMARLRHMH